MERTTSFHTKQTRPGLSIRSIASIPVDTYEEAVRFFTNWGIDWLSRRDDEEAEQLVKELTAAPTSYFRYDSTLYEVVEEVDGYEFYVDTANNSMTKYPGGEEVSDQFFGSDSPSSYKTTEQRQEAERQWKELGWIIEGDSITWEPEPEPEEWISDGSPDQWRNGEIDGIRAIFHRCAVCGNKWTVLDHNSVDVIEGVRCFCEWNEGEE